uniref:Nuclear receptor domain-containing protein n=1 Tax=Caenorhabditis japonica TaxID=281687 RepID=A0A8R1HJJ0_CAEJA
MIDSSSPSTSSSSSTPKSMSEKCLVCFQPAHGNHFGADCCRACAAFFRRVFVTHKQQFECRKGDNRCAPDVFGRWICKRCRADKCFQLGMKPDNIQRNRDRFVCSENFYSAKRRKLDESIIPLSVERFVGRKTIYNYSLRDGSKMEHITFFDLSPIISDADYILKKTPKIDNKLKFKSSLEQLTHGLRVVRKSQVWESLPEMRKIGKAETWKNWVEEMRRAGKWIMHFEEFRELEQEQKLKILKCMWHLFTRMERIAMTAEMRSQKLCENHEFVFDPERRINYKQLEIDTDWFSDQSHEVVKSFIGPLHIWFCDQLIIEFMELKPTDEELTYMLCNLCFHMTGNKLGGRIQEILERLQDILANDLHKYYLGNDKNSRYSHRLTKMLALNRKYQSSMTARRQGIFLADTFSIFRVKMSHPEMFLFSC